MNGVLIFLIAFLTYLTSVASVTLAIYPSVLQRELPNWNGGYGAPETARLNATILGFLWPFMVLIPIYLAWPWITATAYKLMPGDGKELNSSFSVEIYEAFRRNK